LKFDAI